MSESFPFDTAGAKDFFGTLRNFGRHYQTHEEVGPVFTSVVFATLPTVALEFDANLSQGQYLLMVDYSYSHNQNNSDVVTDVLVDDVLQGGVKAERVARAFEDKPRVRTFNLNLTKDAHNFKFRFGPLLSGTAALTDISFKLWRVK